MENGTQQVFRHGKSFITSSSSSLLLFINKTPLYGILQTDEEMKSALGARPEIRRERLGDFDVPAPILDRALPASVMKMQIKKKFHLILINFT